MFFRPGLCKEECFLEVFPDIDNGDACQACGRTNNYWQDKNLAALDLNVTVNYTRESMLIGTTMTTFARDITTMLHSKGVVNVSSICLSSWSLATDSILIAQSIAGKCICSSLRPPTNCCNGSALLSSGATGS